MKKYFNNRIFLLFNDLISQGGIQKYNLSLSKSLKSQFPQYKFKEICLVLKKNSLRCWDKIKFVFKVIFSVFKGTPKLLACSHINLSPLALLLKKLFELPYIVLAHGVEVWDIKKGLKFQGLSNADYIISVSSYTKNKMAENGIGKSKIKILPNTVDTDFFSPRHIDRKLFRSLNLKNKFIMLTVARLSKKERYKGHGIILEVLQNLSDDFIWLVVGEGGDSRRLKEKAKRLGVSGKVWFLGKVENSKLVDYYNLCNLFIMPSQGEGFGIVFLEALACGKPVVAGNRDGSREPLLNGELGFLVNPDSKQEIIEAINIIYKGKDKRSDSNYLREKVKENFGIEAFNKKAKEIFNQIL